MSAARGLRRENQPEATLAGMGLCFVFRRFVGKRMMKRLPFPGRLSTRISPECRLRMFCEVKSPMLADTRLPRVFSRGWNRVSISAGSIPAVVLEVDLDQPSRTGAIRSRAIVSIACDAFRRRFGHLVHLRR
jgi:hypothetical protein